MQKILITNEKHHSVISGVVIYSTTQPKVYGPLLPMKQVTIDDWIKWGIVDEIAKTDKSLNNSQWISIIGGLLFVVISASEIVWRFKTLETSYQQNQEKTEIRLEALESRIDELNNRIDRKINPIETELKELRNKHN